MTEQELLIAYATTDTLQTRLQNLAHQWRTQAETAHVTTAAMLLEHARELENALYRPKGTP